MSARAAAVIPRLLGVVIVSLLATAAVTFAASGAGETPESAPAPVEPAEPAVLVVPDVRNQVYVFAKGTLEDDGFAWQVVGPVKGYAANVVATQSPAPGTRLLAKGTPLVTLQLARNGRYAEKGDPENESPYAGTAPQLAPYAGEPQAEAAPRAPAAAKPEAAAKPKPKSKPKAKPSAKPAGKPAAKRPPAFAVAGAPAEPLDEIPLDERARRLAAWVERNPKPTDANVRHWLYQHSWIVTGAGFGWWRGAEALEILIRVDLRVEQLWGVGAKSRLAAAAALKDVRARGGS